MTPAWLTGFCSWSSHLGRRTWVVALACVVALARIEREPRGCDTHRTRTDVRSVARTPVRGQGVGWENPERVFPPNTRAWYRRPMSDLPPRQRQVLEFI